MCICKYEFSKISAFLIPQIFIITRFSMKGMQKLNFQKASLEAELFSNFVYQAIFSTLMTETAAKYEEAH